MTDEGDAVNTTNEYEIHRDGASNDPGDYVERFPTCEGSDGEEYLCRYSCLDVWGFRDAQSQELEFSYELRIDRALLSSPGGGGDDGLAKATLRLEERMLIWVAEELGLIDCDDMRSDDEMHPPLVGALASYGMDVRDTSVGECTVDTTTSIPSEECIPTKGYVTLDCQGPMDQCEDIVRELLQTGMTSDGFLDDVTSPEIIKVTWIGRRARSSYEDEEEATYVEIGDDEMPSGATARTRTSVSYAGLSIIFLVMFAAMFCVALLVKRRRDARDRDDADEGYDETNGESCFVRNKSGRVVLLDDDRPVAVVPELPKKDLSTIVEDEEKNDSRDANEE